MSSACAQFLTITAAATKAVFIEGRAGPQRLMDKLPAPSTADNLIPSRSRSKRKGLGEGEPMSSACARFPTITTAATKAVIAWPLLNSFSSPFFSPLNPRLSKTGVIPAVLPVKGLPMNGRCPPLTGPRR